MPEEILENPQPTESKPTNWPKIILVAVLGFAILAGAALAGYWYGTKEVQQIEKPTATPQSTTPTVEDETRSWKTYTNTKHGYSFKYPPIAQVKSHTREGGYQEENQTSDSIAIVKSIPEFSHVINVMCLSNCLSNTSHYEEPTIEFKDLNQYVEERLNIQGDRIEPKNELYEILSVSLKIITYKNITVDGRDTIRLVAETLPASGIAPGFYLNAAYIEKNPGEVWAVESAQWGDLDKSISMLETILGTFRFLD